MPKTFIPNRFKEYALSENETDKYLFSNSRNDFFVAPLKLWREQVSIPVYPHRKTVTSFFFILSGSAEMNCGLDTFQLKPNSVFMVPQGYLTSIGNMDPETNGYYCHFDFSIFSLVAVQKLKQAFPFLFTDEHPLISLQENSSEALSFLLYRLTKEYMEHRSNLNLSLVSSYLVAAFQELKLFYPEEHSESFTRNARITSDFKELLYNEIKETKSAAEFAEKLNVSPNHLNKVIKTTTGKTAKSLINEALVLEAKNLLFETDLSIGEVAAELGMEDPAYFSRLFKQHEGKTPQQFRKMIEKSK